MKGASVAHNAGIPLAHQVVGSGTTFSDFHPTPTRRWDIPELSKKPSVSTNRGVQSLVRQSDHVETFYFGWFLEI